MTDPSFNVSERVHDVSDGYLSVCKDNFAEQKHSGVGSIEGDRLMEGLWDGMFDGRELLG